MRVMQLRCDCELINMFHFSARLHEVAANHNAGIGVGVVDHCDVIAYYYFHAFQFQ